MKRPAIAATKRPIVKINSARDLKPKGPTVTRVSKISSNKLKAVDSKVEEIKLNPKILVTRTR